MEQSEENRPSKINPASRLRLGKGLGALLGGGGKTSDEPMAATELTAGASGLALNAEVGPDIRRLPVDQVAANPFQPRRTFDPAALESLAMSLKANGLVQPIVVMRVEGGFQLVAGERRLRAAKLAGLTDIPAIVRQLDSAAQARLALIENIHREDLNPMDRAESYHALMQDGQLTQQALAELLGDQRVTIANHLRLLELHETVRHSVRDGRLSFGHAKIIAGLPQSEQSAISERCISEAWSVRQLEAHLAVIKAPPEKGPPRPASPHYHDLAQQLTRALGVRAQVQPSAKKGSGKVTLHYASLDQFDHLLSQLGIKLSD